MVSQKIFMGCLVVLILFNFLFFVTDYNEEILDYSRIIGIVVTFGLLVVIISIIPVTSAGGSIRWLISTLIAVTIFYSWTFTIIIPYVYESPPLTIGVGLCSLLIEMFSSDITSLSFIGYLFFQIIGVLGVVSGVIMLAGGSSE